MAFTTSSQVTEWALLLQPRSPHRALSIRANYPTIRLWPTSPVVVCAQPSLGRTRSGCC